MKKIELKGAREIRALPLNSQKVLLEFLRDWLAWATTKPLTDKYDPSNGLCFCVIDFLNSCAHRPVGSWPHFKELDAALDSALIGASRNPIYALEFPFGKFNYQWRSALRRQHKCRKRLAWVRAVIEVLEEQE